MNTRNKQKLIKFLRADKVKVKAPPQQHKVKVQYIQNHKIFDGDELVPEEMINLCEESVTEEVENVEYLDDVLTIDHDVAQSVVTTADEFQDTFYPNAIQCLIALYREKYQQMLGKRANELCALEMWNEISREMNECYFNFDSKQVQEKYKRLRRQYFDLRTRADVEAFDYFNSLHQIYQDKHIQQLLTGEHSKKVPGEQRTQHDDVLFGEESEVVEEIYPLVTNEVLESGDVEEKEFPESQAEEETAVIETIKTHEINGLNSTQNEAYSFLFEPDTAESNPVRLCAKRMTLNKCEFPTPRKKLKTEDISDAHASTLEEESKQNLEAPCDAAHPVAGKNMSLAEYNTAQQRRHEENMQLLRENLRVQEALLEMQGKVLEALKKRF